MATIQEAPNSRICIGEEEELINTIRLEYQQLLLSLPKGGHTWGSGNLFNYQGFWYTGEHLQAVMTFQRHFIAFETDLIIATLPRSGTLWLKSLAFAIVNRRQHCTSFKDHPLLTTSGHQLVPLFEINPQLYGTINCLPDFINFDDQCPRLLATHIPYSSLAESIKNTKCKIVYVCRNPKDNFISLWHFNKTLAAKKGVVDQLIPLEEALDLFCNGVSYFGPFWDHVLGYWKQSLEMPEKVLFLKYEDMKKDHTLKKLAGFLGYPFSAEEESEGVIEDISRLCSFGYLKDLEVNKNGISSINIENKFHFRKGEVGDWKNYLTPPMAERLDRLIEEKLHGSGLVFEDCID